MKILSSFIFVLYLFGCGPQYAQDPNAYVFVTSKYENEPERIIDNNGCKSQLNCVDKSTEECVIILYEYSERFNDEGNKLVYKELYLSAGLEFMKAMCMLVKAEIMLEKINDKHIVINGNIVNIANLKENIKEKIKLCELKINRYRSGN
jgi:hypothetical protein